MSNVLLKIQNMYKNFGPTQALNNVELTVCRGEIRGFIGENGSGKSTLSSIVSGILQPTSGYMELNEVEHKPHSMIDALNKGIGMIVQEAGTVSGLTVAENMFLGREKEFAPKFIKKNKGVNKVFGGVFINNSQMTKEAQKALDSIGANIDASIVIDRLDMQDRKLVEVAKVVMANPDLLIIDETTTALSQEGREIVYQIMERWRLENKAVLFISHDLEEIMDKCTHLTVLRDGNIITTFEKNNFDEEEIKTAMIGREMVGDYYPPITAGLAEAEKVPVLSVLGLITVEGMEDLTFDLYKGEILGIGGMSHCGMHQLGRYLFGIDKPISGSVVHCESQTEIVNPRVAMKCGFGYVSKDRDKEALVLEASILDNIAISGLDKFQVSKAGLVVYSKERKYVDKQIDNLSIKCESPYQYTSSLSGGNKQKVVFGKWLGRNSDILILDCPTRGVDVGVKQAMYHLMDTMRKEGKSIIMISEELSELIGMSDRVLIMKDFKISGQVAERTEITEQNLFKYML